MDDFVSRSYHIIVMEGNSSTKSPSKWLPSELGPYNASTYAAGQPYITAVLSSYIQNISIGDKNVYRLSNESIAYVNVALKSSTEYLVFQRAFLSEVRFLIFFSTALFITSHFYTPPLASYVNPPVFGSLRL